MRRKGLPHTYKNMGWQQQSRESAGQWKQMALLTSDATIDPTVFIATEQLFDTTVLNARDRAEFEKHVAEVDPVDGLSNGERYARFNPDHVSLDLVWIRRGLPRQLQYRLHKPGREPIIVPACVAAAATALPDRTHPLTVLEFHRQQAHDAWQRAVDNRSRPTRGKKTINDLADRRDKENAAYSRWLQADHDYLSKKAELATQAHIEAVGANIPGTDYWDMEQDRLFDIVRAGGEPESHTHRLIAATEAAREAKEQAHEASLALRHWQSDLIQKKVARSQVTRV